MTPKVIVICVFSTLSLSGCMFDVTEPTSHYCSKDHPGCQQDHKCVGNLCIPKNSDSGVPDASSTKWWNTSYKYRMDIKDKTKTEVPVAINGPKGFQGKTIWTNGNQGALAIYYNNATDYAVVVGHAKKAAFLTEGGGPNNTPTAVFPITMEAAYLFGKAGDPTNSTKYGSSYDGKLKDVAWSASGMFGGGLTFDATKDYHFSGYKEIKGVDLAKEWSLSMWLKVDKKSTSHNYLAGGFDGSLDNQWGAQIHLTSVTEVEVSLGGVKNDMTHTVFSKTGTLLVDGKWKHVVVVHSLGKCAANINVFVDGVQLTRTTKNGKDCAKSYHDPGVPWHFVSAKRNDGKNLYRGLTGSVDNISMWTKALSSGEIKEIYENGQGLNMTMGTQVERK